MYQAHFGLEKGLFDNGIAQDGGVFIGERQRLAIANCKIALTTFDSALVLTGPAGVGKTTLAASALRDSSTRLALGWLNGTPANASELLELLLAEFGFNVTRTGRVERLQMWRQFLNEASATDSRVFVIAERAEDLAPEILRALESLTTADPNGCRGANLVLLGQAALHEHLKSPALESLRQRVRLRQRLEPLSADEVRAYLEHHVSRAGGSFAKIFAADAITALHRHSRGIPRVINNLCETALTLAAALEMPALTAEIVARVALDMLGLDAGDAVQAATAATPASAVSSASPTNAAAQLGPAPAPTAITAVALTPSAATAASVPITPAAPAASFAAAGGGAVAPSAAAAPAVLPSRLGTTAAVAPASGAAPVAAPLFRAGNSPAAAAAAAPLPEIVDEPAEFDGGATDIAPEVLRDDTAGDSPDVQMADFPVLTDAVEAPLVFERVQRPPASPRTPAFTPPLAAAPPKPAARAPEPVSVPRAAEQAPAPKPPLLKAAPAPKPAPAAAAKPALAPAPTPAAQPEDDDALRQTQTMRALASAKSIDDISNSMAETLFGEADLDMLSAALASAGWSEPEADDAKIDASLAAAAADGEHTEPDPFDAFDLFGLGPDAPLELIDDSSEPRPGPPRKIASGR
jgi:type II secretory pathway predicted ATPase ExeA